MSTSVKIFRPWDRHESLESQTQPSPDCIKLEQEFTQISERIRAKENHTHIKHNQQCDKTIKESKYYNQTDINFNRHLQHGPMCDKYNRTLLDASDKTRHVDEPSSYSSQYHPNSPRTRSSENNCDSDIRNQDNKLHIRTNHSDGDHPSSRNTSLLSEEHTEPYNNSRFHRRHSRKHKSKRHQSKKPESLDITRSNTSSPCSSSLDTTLLSQDSIYNKSSELSNFEKYIYPDFRSLEFLPEDILDPILMSGLPLGAPLDPYWSNLALDYIKSHEQSLKAKHQRPKKFNCPHCNVAFSNNGQLKGHIRIHTGERPFKCEAEGCGKSFTRNEELTRHKRIHSGLRPYPCTHCGKKFGRKDHLKKHLRTHFPQPRYVPVYPYMYAGGYTTVML